jgi:hypothetical protein
VTRRLKGGDVLLEKEAPATCAFCGAKKELRPYGPNRECLCFACAMKDEATTKRVFARDVLDLGETH